MDIGKEMIEKFAEQADFDSDLFPPRHAVDEAGGDKIVGTLEGPARKLYALSMLYGRERDQTILDAKYNEHSCDEVNGKAKELDAKHDILLNMFWYLCRAEFNLWEADSIGLRAGWVVVLAPVRGPKLPPGLAKIFGIDLTPE